MQEFVAYLPSLLPPLLHSVAAQVCSVYLLTGTKIQILTQLRQPEMKLPDDVGDEADFIYDIEYTIYINIIYNM